MAQPKTFALPPELQARCQAVEVSPNGVTNYLGGGAGGTVLLGARGATPCTASSSMSAHAARAQCTPWRS